MKIDDPQDKEERREVDAQTEETDERPPHRGLRETFRQALDSARQQRTAQASSARRDLSRDRTKTLVLLAAAVTAAVLMFLGVFSAPSGSKRGQAAGHATPNLGRKEVPDTRADSRSGRSVTPLLSADLQNNQSPTGDRLTPDDIENTSRQPRLSPPIATAPKLTAPYALNKIGFSDPVERRAAVAQPAAPATASGPDRVGESLGKASLVFVRAAEHVPATSIQAPQQAIVSRNPQTAALPAGTRLVARLQSAVSTAVRAPVVAVIEYNYERDGEIVVPAGTKAFGELQQANNSGHVGIQFHSLQMTDGTVEKIDGASMDLKFGPLKGYVGGRRTGTRLLVRSLTGVGTMAAYIVGVRGGPSGLNGPISEGALLREQVANNIALGGEQELTRMAFTQNIVVTIPGNTRFYIVLQKGAIDGGTRPAMPAAADLRAGVAADGSAHGGTPLSIQELRELMELRNELTRMYQDSGRNQPATAAR